MPKTKTAKPPKFAEPHTVDIPDIESYTALIAKPPYTYLRRIQPQSMVSMLLKRLHTEGKRYVRIYMPEECFAPSYLKNPPLFAKIVRQQHDACYQFVVARHEQDAARVRITASENAPQKGNSYLATCGASILGEMDKWKEHKSFALIFPYSEMPISYKNSQHVFRFRLEAWLREKLNQPELEVRLSLADNGYRLTTIPKNNSPE